MSRVLRRNSGSPSLSVERISEKSLEKTRDAARAEAAQMRSDLAKVRVDLKSARHHLAHALHVEKALTQVEKKMAKLLSRKKKTKKK